MEARLQTGQTDPSDSGTFGVPPVFLAAKAGERLTLELLLEASEDGGAMGSCSRRPCVGGSVFAEEVYGEAFTAGGERWA